MLKKIFIVSSFFSLLSCSSAMQTDMAYNDLGRAEHLALHSEGYVIAIEKQERERIGNPEVSYPERFRFLPGAPTQPAEKKRYLADKAAGLDFWTPDEKTAAQIRNEKFRDNTNDGKAMLVTHVVGFFSQPDYMYNAYKNKIANTNKGEPDYTKGYEGLAKFQSSIVDKITAAAAQGKPYSHIFLMSMGWHNDQLEAIWRDDVLVKNLKDTAGDRKVFRPLLISLTWPSAWKTRSDSWFMRQIGHLLSYMNKSNDADEIGYTIANWIVNKQIPEIREAAGPGIDFPQVVAIGHSMGARLLSRAIFSKDHLRAAAPAKPSVDLFIGLQGAFSAERFVDGRGAEGWPYADFRSFPTRIVLTTSKKDSANAVALFVTGSKHVGGKPGLYDAKQHGNIFEIVKWDRQPDLAAAFATGKVVMIDATSIINGAHPEHGIDDAHNDILNHEVARMIWACMDAKGK